MLGAALAAPADRPFLSFWQGDACAERLAFGEFTHQAQRYAAWLAARGVAAGATVALVLPHGSALMAAFAGALWLGAVPTILAYPTFKVDPQKYRQGLAGVAAHLDATHVIIADELPTDLRDALMQTPTTHVVAPPATLPSPAAIPPRAAVAPTDVAFIQHSGGTTGLQKSVAITHAQALRHLQRLADGMAIRPTDVMYSWLPLYHDMGLITAFLLPLVTHIPLVTQATTEWVLRPLRMLELMAAERCTLAYLPNFAFQFLADRLQRQRLDLDLSHVRAIVSASEPVRAANMDALRHAGCEYGLGDAALHTLYGMAENVMGITMSAVAAGKPPRRLWVKAASLQRDHQVVPVAPGEPSAVELVSCGRCLPGTSVSVANANGAPLPAGWVGELVVRSDTLFAGYYNRPDLTAETLRDGALWSGDLGFCLDGEVYVTGRRKDLIIVGGRNIFPEDVEAVVNEHPAIHRGRVVAFGIVNAATGTEDLVVVGR